MIHTEELEYNLNSDLTAKAYITYDKTKINAHNKHLPCILIFHDWGGRSSLFINKAKDIANLGYIGIAVDMYGAAKVVTRTEDKVALLSPLKENREELQRRVKSSFNMATQLEYVDSSKILAIGYCFGGMCVLDLARAESNIKGVISFHGLLDEPRNVNMNEKINSKILVLHGYEDKLVPPENIITFANEMTKKEADWQLHAYGLTHHAFTNPSANNDEIGLHYSRNADKRSWKTAVSFFDEVI